MSAKQTTPPPTSEVKDAIRWTTERMKKQYRIDDASAEKLVRDNYEKHERKQQEKKK